MLIPAGHVPPNPTTLLQNSNFNFMIDTVKELFDYVIVDIGDLHNIFINFNRFQEINKIHKTLFTLPL